MQVLLDDIIIKDRVRTDIGDLKPLMESMRKHGQLNPVTLSRENELIAGHRRTLAARELGWKFIDAHIVERATEVEKLQLELEENVHRKDFSPEELLAGYRRLDKLLHPSVGKRIRNAVRAFFGKLLRRKPKPAPSHQPADPSIPEPADNQNKNVQERKTAQDQNHSADIIGNQFGV